MMKDPYQSLTTILNILKPLDGWRGSLILWGPRQVEVSQAKPLMKMPDAVE